MTFTIQNLANSIATHLQTLLPGVRFYEDPNQQGTKCPCAFIQLMSSEVALRRQKVLQRTLRLDLTYLEDYNLPDLQRRYQQASEVLDLNMETFAYTETVEEEVNGAVVPVTRSAVLRTQNRQAQIDLDGLHYKFDLNLWLTPEEDGVLMRSLAAAIEVGYVD